MADIKSIHEFKAKKAKAEARKAMSMDRRVAELEADVLRLIEFSTELEREFYLQEKYLRKLTRMLIDYIPEHKIETIPEVYRPSSQPKPDGNVKT